ncbi:glycosyltransferase 61 family protein [Synechocystis sp. B12]|nr:glycosyltransferase 61 family protein [Synechocystis sp. B12]
MASAFQAVGQWQKALDCLNECLAINWGQTKVFGEIAMIFLRAGYQKEAFQYLSEMVGQNNQIFESILTGLKQIIRGEVKTNKELLLIRCSLLKALLSGEEVVDFCQQLTALNNLIKKSLKNNTIFKESELKGFYERTQDWVTSQEFGSFYPALPESFIRFLPPHTLDKFIHYSFRFGVGISLPETFVVSIPQGRVWLNKDESRMAIITPDNNLLGDLSPESPALSPNHPDKHPSRHSLLQRSKLPPVQSVSGTVAVLSGLLNDVYFHWLFDLLPRFYLLQLAGWHWDDIDWFVVNNQLPFQEESLAMLGVPAAKVIHHSGQVDLHLQADNLLVPSFPGTVAWMPRWACGFLRNTFLSSESVQSKPNKRIYIRRNLSSSRRLINEEEVITCLERLGFEAINLELLSMQEQANLFVQAEIVVAPMAVV